MIAEPDVRHVQHGQLYDFASTIIAQRLSQIAGVGQVIVGGSSLPAVRVDVDPTQLASYGLTMPNVHSVLQLQNSTSRAGQLGRPDRVRHRHERPDQPSRRLQPARDRDAHGNAVQPLATSPTSTTAAEHPQRRLPRTASRRCTIIIFRQPGANIIDTVDRVRAAMPRRAAIDPARRSTSRRARPHD